MEQFEKDLMKIWKCSDEWPVCLYDFAFKNKNPQYLVYRVENNLEEYAIDDYFYGKNK